ncbi:acetaldehyde dehydrogenase [Novosphingobium fuchskuhlense]|uniref:Acetaldehyde dehydrogenase n=1 Tax=Novosphingobium fuchskuhlense TaxID=1117702 RepID=A0A117USH5_9SPHN|nr:DUF779 domain-containing protein [Novosphingobium fuchskuhlense]KUR70051.1 acetaldehyde dehydrogenase [Novosphingobium fuchskuhlense]
MIRATAAAVSLLKSIRADHGEVIFHQSGGCCDGSSPMCFPDGEFRLGANDVLIGQIDGTRFYMSAHQLEKWGPRSLLLDAVPGRGGMFSLDNGREARFLLRADRDKPSDGASSAD